MIPPSALAASTLQSPVASSDRMLVHTEVPLFEPPSADVAARGSVRSVYSPPIGADVAQLDSSMAHAIGANNFVVLFIRSFHLFDLGRCAGDALLNVGC